MKRYFQFKKTVIVAFALAAISFAGCEKYVIKSTEIDPNEARSFKEDILPIFSNHSCTNCHVSGKNALDLEAAKAYASLKSNKCITTTPPESAKLYNHFVNSSGTSIPHSGITLLDVEEQYILYWITQGAKDN
jgi:ssDNA-binding Zn-finger/Zn-ribbon topoisomerase 1